MDTLKANLDHCVGMQKMDSDVKKLPVMCFFGQLAEITDIFFGNIFQITAERGKSMRKNETWVPGEGFQTVAKDGFRISRPKHLTNKLKLLAWNLGKQYYLARVECWNCVHRMLDEGWNIIIYPVHTHSDWYVIEIRCDYDREIAGRLHGIHEEYLRIHQVCFLSACFLSMSANTSFSGPP